MKVCEKWKKLNRPSKFITIATFIVITLLCANIITEIVHISHYKQRVEAGNAHWEQVEDRIERYEDKIDVFIELNS